MSQKNICILDFVIRDQDTPDPYILWSEVKDVIKKKVSRKYYLELIRYLVKNNQRLRIEGLSTKILKDFLDTH